MRDKKQFNVELQVEKEEKCLHCGSNVVKRSWEKVKTSYGSEYIFTINEADEYIEMYANSDVKYRIVRCN